VHHWAVQARPPSAAPFADRFGRWTPALVALGLIVVFLVTRLPWLDADIPQWELTWYSPIDEFGYSVPAFNLLHYGTWVHQAAPWAPLEGPPINVAQNLVAAVTMWLVGYSYWGRRASSIVFVLFTFLALVSIVRRQAAEAREFEGASPRLALAVVVAAIVLLLADFSFLLSARIVEPTVTRLAAAAVIVAFACRGTFLGEKHGLLRSAAFGGAVTAAVLFVYIYNAFLLPAALLTVAWWAFRIGGGAAVARHGIAFLAGCAAVTVLFFGLIALIYRESPIEWYRTWISAFATTTRGNGLSLGKIAAILEANIFRLDPAFVGVVLAGVPVFAWTLVRRPSAWLVLLTTSFLAFVVQSAFVADYPERKFIMVMLFALPVAASAVLGWRAFQAWVMTDPRRLVALTVWLTGALCVTALVTPLRAVIPHGSLLARIVFVAGGVGVAALIALLVLRRPAFVTAATAALCLAILAPLLYADAAFVYRRPTFTYRDAQIAVGRTIDGQTTAGGWSFGMQLYNTSRPVLSEYTSRIEKAGYDEAVVRLFREGTASSLFDYVDAKTRSRWESLGFRLADTYAIILPRGQHLGRYLFGT
jgi:hypothetical protein